MSNVLPIHRPHTRADCLEGGINAARPCKWTRCYWNTATLGMRATPISGLCVLDLAEEEKTLQEIADVTGTTRENIRQVEVKALRKLRRLGVGLGALRALREHSFVTVKHALTVIAEES